MIRNYLKLTLKLLKRKKIFSFITIFGMAIPLLFLMIIVTSVSHFTSHEMPESNFDRVILFDDLRFSITRNEGMSGNMHGNPSYHFIKNYIKPMKSPYKVGVSSFMDYFNQYVGDRKVRLKTRYTDDNFWEIADFEFAAGRAYHKKELESTQLVAVIDEYTKKLVFGEDSAIGKTMKVFKKHYKIIGVVSNVDISRQYTHANIWLPITTSNRYMVNDIYSSGCNCFLMAKEKEQFAQIEKEFTSILKNFDLGKYEGLTKIDGDISYITFNNELKNILYDLFSIEVDDKYILYIVYTVIFFFFIVLPAINLLYIHSSRIRERSSEIGVRKSFGGAKQKLAGQFVIENITFSLFSGLLGLLLTFLIFGIVNRSELIPGLHLSINSIGLLLCFALWLFFGISTGLVPGLRMSRVKAIDALQQQELHHNLKILNRKMKRIKMVLVVEFIVTFMALVVILTFVFKFNKNHSYPLGFDYNDVYQVSIEQYDNDAMGWFGDPLDNQEACELIKAHHFVSYYGESQWNEPFHDGYTTVVDGIRYKDTLLKEGIHVTITDTNMDDIIKLNVTDGRWFDETDDRDDYYPIVLNKLCKEELFGNRNPIGEYTEIRGTKCQVIGVVDYYKYQGEYSLPVKMVFSQSFFPDMSIKCHGRGRTDFFRVKPGTSYEGVNTFVRQLSLKYPDYEINITSIDSLHTKYLRKTLGPIIAVGILFAFVFLIVLLGLFGVLWYDISLRKQEIGIRRATGGSSSRIFKLIVKEMLVWASIGILLGIVLFVQIPMLKVIPIEFNNCLISILCSTLIIYLMVAVCCIIPAKQAAKIQPALALYEQ